MTKDAVTEIGVRIDALAAKLGVVGAHVWQIACRQAYVEGYACLGLSVFFAAVIVGCRVVFVRATTRGAEDRYFDPDSWRFGSVVVAIISAIVLIVVFGNGIEYLLNPEYYALKSISELLK